MRVVNQHHSNVNDATGEFTRPSLGRKAMKATF